MSAIKGSMGSDLVIGGGKGLAAPPVDGKEAGPLAGRLLYCDGLLLVLNKPAGLPVHGGPSGKPNVEDFLPALRFGYRETPRLAHRLDQDTSGCLALGRNQRALRKLGRLFSGGRVEKSYWALVVGRPSRDEGEIDLPLKKVSLGRQWRIEARDDGQRAVTRYRLLGFDGACSWLALHPLTGRTHQLRVHLAATGFPIVGDPLYGSGEAGLCLHARAISLPLYDGRPAVSVVAPPPASLQAKLAACGWHPEPPPEGGQTGAGVDSDAALGHDGAEPSAADPAEGTGKT